MKTTPFTDVHIALGAKMHEFAGFNMPIEYTGIIDEHMTVVNGVGVFDVSPMWETSNTPTPFTTVMCSSIIPVYSIGMLKPANSCILAPSAMCTSVNGVVFMIYDL